MFNPYHQATKMLIGVRISGKCNPMTGAIMPHIPWFANTPILNSDSVAAPVASA